ncbi:SAM-dependent methyltransferase [Erythrobacter sp. QSSC1-22B]|uniref:SAM-dependent methyltransferase n=1 Tax=Erythrobacter sp. QSSC1-22B TaxID=1860125 RepID=UPI0018F897C1|nr:SAM-dependent methyltransferase [Erythrobacter sp. QSSC1-22B]
MVRKYLGSRHAQFVEPSAGSGSFFRLLPPGSIGYDIDPKSPDIIKADFLKTTLPCVGEIVIIGNPPFGKNSSMAVKFFNHAARQAKVIAFILPRTFQKTSIINRLDPNFHIAHEELVQDNAFIFEGKPKNVPTVFQIWVRKTEKREKLVLPIEHSDFEFTTADRAEFAIKRVGVGAGRLHHDFTLSPNSHYFLRANVGGAEATMGTLDFEAFTKRTAGSPSLSKTELVALYTERKTLQSDPAFKIFRRLLQWLRDGRLHLKDRVKFWAVQAGRVHCHRQLCLRRCNRG